MPKGIWNALGAYTLWGLLPVYWKWLHHVPAPELLSHRIVWSCLTLVIVLLVTRQSKNFVAQISNTKVLRVYLIAALLIGFNWLTYVWAVNAGYIIETSLGYFINPLFSVLLGVVFFHERLRVGQWVAIALAACGVLYLTYLYGSLPWIALTLTFTFGLYGLVKKIASLNSLDGLTLETGILFLPALGYLIYSELSGHGAFLHGGAASDLLLVGAGLATTVPLLLFASAARSIPLSLVGLMQYIAPTIQFLLGVFVYREPFSPSQLIGFSIIWVALIVFAAESVITNQRQVKA
jgi:chloramphenicol-sensitive protein RarD